MATQQEDNLDAQAFRRMKEQYLNGDENTCVGLIIGVLKEWESGTAEPQMAKFLHGIRELGTFRFAEQCAEMLQGHDDAVSAKVLEAVKTLRQLFGGTLIKVTRNIIN